MTGRVFARLLVLMFLFVAEGATLAACTEGPHTPDATYVYKSVDGRNLQLFVYRDVNASKAASARPAIVLFHGGGWRTGRPESFARLAGCLADRSGMVAITVSYRLGSGVRSGAELGVEDAISAMSWVRQYAGMLGINRHQIAAAGGSAGGHLALATVLFEDTMRPFTRHAVSARPDALVLFNPVVDLVGKWEDVFKTDLRAISPLQQLDGPLPPTILFQGTADRVTPLSSAQRFVEKARDAGSRQVELVTFAGRGHGFSQRTYGGSDDFTTTQERTAAFLSRLGWDLTQGGASVWAGRGACGDGLCERGESQRICPTDCRQFISRSEQPGLIVDRSLAPRGVRKPDGDLLLGVKRTVSGQNLIQAIAGKPARDAWEFKGVVEESPVQLKADLGNPAPFADRDGRLLMAFRDHTPTANGITYQLRVEYSDDGGQTWNRWAAGSDGVIDRSEYGLWEPFLYRYAHDDLRVVYAKERVPRQCNGRAVEKQDVVMRVSRDGGRSWGGEQVVASSGLSRDGVPSVARLRDGSYVLVFESWRKEACEELNPRLVIRSMQSRDGVRWDKRNVVYQPAPRPGSGGARLQDYPVASWPYAIRLRDGRLLVLFTTNESHPDPSGQFPLGEKAYDVKYMLTRDEAGYDHIEWEGDQPFVAYASTAGDEVRFASAVELEDGALMFMFAMPARYKIFELR